MHLLNDGHEVVEFHYEIYDMVMNFKKIITGMFMEPAAKAIWEKGENIEIGSAFAYQYYLSSNPLKKLVPLLLQLTGQKRIATDMKNFHKINVDQLNELVKLRSKHMADFNKAWMKAGLDVMLSPTYPVPALTHESSEKLRVATADCMLHNYIHYPAGVIPVTTVREDEQFFHESHDDVFTKGYKQTMENAAGMPISVQVTSEPFKDEAAIAVMEILEKKFEFHKRVKLPY